MKYGYFDGKNKEYVVTRPDTPMAWCNYLGTPAYGAIISNNATGYSFVESGADGRLSRFRFNCPLSEQPGRFVYIHDKKTKDYWSNSWQPVAKDINEFKSEARHGTGYTKIMSEYAGVRSETLYYVPLDGLYEVWNFTVTNISDEDKSLSVMPFVEFTSDGNYEQDQVNLQYTYFIAQTKYRDNYMLQLINENCSEAKGASDGSCNDAGNEVRRFFAAAGAKVDSYEGDREAFLGKYRTFANPIAVENGVCNNGINYNKNSIGALQFNVDLKPGESKTINFIFGEGGDSVVPGLIKKYEDTAIVEKELADIIEYWHSRINRLQVETPDENFNNMVNMWNQYQAMLTSIWSRTASFEYCGLRNGLGYRDTVQDIQGLVSIDPVMAKEKFEYMLSAQVDNGGGLPIVRWGFVPGKEGTPDDLEWGKMTGHPFYRADDALWLFPTVNTYIMETGDSALLDKVIPFSNKGEGTVYEHLRRAIQFNLDRVGKHELPAGLHADWNDCLRLGEKGESSFVAFQLFYAFKIFKSYAEFKGIEADVKWADELITKYDKIFQDVLWNEDRFVRGYTEDDYIVGHRDNEEGSMWLNPQSWAVISGAARPEQAEKAMDSVERILNTESGAMVFYPAFRKYGIPVARMALMNPGTKENAGVFSQPQGWLIQAEALLGHGNKAMMYYNESSPASANENADIRMVEPYAHCQAVEGKESPFQGRGHVHWLTGTASTVIIGVTQGILGIRPTIDSFVMNPSIPSDWKEFKVKRIWRNRELDIIVDNAAGVEHGVVKTTVNGKEIEGCAIPYSELCADKVNAVKIIMG